MDRGLQVCEDRVELARLSRAELWSVFLLSQGFSGHSVLVTFCRRGPSVLCVTQEVIAVIQGGGIGFTYVGGWEGLPKSLREYGFDSNAVGRHCRVLNRLVQMDGGPGLLWWT